MDVKVGDPNQSTKNIFVVITKIISLPNEIIYTFEPMKQKKPKKRKVRMDKGVLRGAYKRSASSIYRSCVGRANRAGIPIDLSEDQVNSVTSMPCAYCGAGSRHVELIESSVGFVEGNCVPACSTCHTFRKHLSHDKMLSRDASVVKNKGDLINGSMAYDEYSFDD